MRVFFFLVVFSISIFAFEQRFELNFENIAYDKISNEFLTKGDSDIVFDNKYFTTNARVEFLYSSKYDYKRYFLINEFYITKEFDDYTLSLGKKIKYLGELEAYNVTDIYNQKNNLKDQFDKSAKYGAIGGEIIKYFDDNSLEFSIKLYEEDLKYQQYNEKLYLSDKRYTPSIYIGINTINDAFLDNETKIFLFYGYDLKRDILSNTQILSQYAYRVNKLLFLSHIIYEDTIFKTELVYTDVIDYTPISDYTQLSFGVEKSFYEVMEADITLYMEYYSYIYRDNTKIKNIDISEMYDSDIFLALKVNFNDVRSSELKFGILKDISKDERTITLDVSSRIMDSFVLSTKYLDISSIFSDLTRFTFGINYIF